MAEHVEIPEEIERSIRKYLEVSGQATEVLLELCERLDPDRYTDVRPLINSGRLIPQMTIRPGGLRIELVDAITEANIGPIFEYGRTIAPPLLTMIHGGRPN